MKQRLSIVILAVIMTLTSACVKDNTITANFAAKKYFDSWIKVNCPGARMTELGAYILSDEPGTGDLVGSAEEHPYVYMNYKIMDLNGNISAYTDSQTAKQLNEFDSTSYYGPKVSYRGLIKGSYGMQIGLEDVIKDMRVGGKRTVAIPGWLSGTDRYKTAEAYLKNGSGNSLMYELEVTDVVKDITQSQIDSIERYMEHNLHKVDSTKWGFYYIQTCPPTDTVSFLPEDIVYINYTGRLLNGNVFDSSIKDTAKVYGLGLDAEFGNTKVTIAESYTEYALNDGDAGNMIDGFAYCLSHMKTGEKGIAIFTSNLGYNTTTTERIPSYAPLRFDLEMIGKK